MQAKRVRDPRVNFLALTEYMRGVYTAMDIEPPTAVIVFYAVCAAPGEHTVTSLAECCSLTMKASSRHLRTLRNKGWVELRGDAKDTRMRRVHLAPKGADLAKLINAAAVDCAFRVVENVMGEHPSNPNLSLRPRTSHRHR